jgi:glycosyltransferase involved in cell wall biosynthesis
MTLVSVVTPCFNEKDNVESCYNAVKKLFESTLIEFEYEHIFSDNSSFDGTKDILKRLASNDKNVKVLINSRNVGPFKNIWSALKHSSGDVVIPFLPADLQDPPLIIGQFISRWQSGDKVVYGIRTNRQESIILRFLRNTYYNIISKFAESEIPKNAGEFLLVDRETLNSVLETDDEYPYIRGLIAQTAAKSSSIEYTWQKRKSGKSKLTYFHLIDQAINGFVSTSRIPARIALLGGFIVSFIGVLLGILIAISFLIDSSTTLTNLPAVVVILLIFGGIQLFFTGLIGEYVLSIHGQVRRVPRMYIMDKINF